VSFISIPQKDVISMRDRIADWDGDTDCYAEIQQALDDHDYIFFPKKPQGYRVTQTLEQTRFGQCLYGERKQPIASNAHSIFLDATSTDNVLLQVRGPNLQLSRLALGGKGRLVANSVLIDADEEGFDNANTGDVDLHIDECMLHSSRRLIQIRGRGLNCINNAFVLFVEGIEIDWPNTFVEGANPDQKLLTGMRVYRIVNNRWHAGSANYLVQNRGTNAANIHGLVITDNYIDTLCALFRGELHDSQINNNMMFNSNTSVFAAIEVTGGKNSQINDNFIGGMQNNGTQSYEIKLGIRLEDCEDMQICNNTFHRITDDVLTLADCNDIDFSHNKMIDCCLENDGAENQRAPVRLNSNITGLQVIDNSHKLTFTPNDWNKSFFVNNTFGYLMPRNVVKGNIYDPTLFNANNFPDATNPVVGAIESDRRMQRYVGNGEAAQVLTFQFRPLAVQVFNIENQQSIMVIVQSAIGNGLVDIVGNTVEVKGVFNTLNSNYMLHAFM